MKKGKYAKRYSAEKRREIYEQVVLSGRNPSVVAGIYHTTRQRIENIVRRYPKDLAEQK